MSIQDHIAQYLRQKLSLSPTLLFYDETGRYHELVKSLATNDVQVVDAQKSFILAREDAQRIFTQVLPADEAARLVVYLPYATPTDNQARIQDPFFMFGLCGTVFPYGPTDRYAELCKACYPGQETKIDTLFKDGEPTFETIDALGGGHTYALLQTLTGGKSDQEILLKLLTASDDKAVDWKKQKGITGEWKAFAKQLLGLKATSSTLPDVQTELWRFVLFSEFVYDLPVVLPGQFGAIPRGGDPQKKLILDVCDTLRKHRDWATIYVERAEAVDAELGLSDQFATAPDLGEIITFSFEDNTFFHRFLTDVLNNQPEQATRNLASVQGNIWEGHDPQRTANWQVARCGAELLQFASNLTETAIRSYKTLATLTDQYAADWYRFDQFQRAFETHADALPDHSELVDTFIRHVRTAYRQRSEALQKHYQSLVQQEGWPGSIPVQNTQLFAKHVEPYLKANSSTAYIWADAFRFELGKEVAAALAKNGHSVDVVPSAAFIPTVTKLAMAALLPEADKKLVLRHVGDSLEAELDGVILKNLQDRVSVLRARFGDRMKHQSVDTFLNSPKSKPVDLLCLSFAEMDTAGESLASNALLPIQEASKKLVRVVNKLKQAGYKQVVIAADHGFMLHPDYEPGDNIAKPVGNWWLVKKRSLVGKGSAGEYCLSFTPEQLGIRSDATNFVFARQYSVFQANTRYFHEGLSIQENLVPVLLIALSTTKTDSKAEVTLSYKTRFITSRRPSIQVAAFHDQLFAEPLTVRIEAVADGKIVGTLSAQAKVNTLASTVEITPGESMKLTLDMEEEFEGDFLITATNPATGKTYHTLSLTTEYM